MKLEYKVNRTSWHDYPHPAKLETGEVVDATIRTFEVELLPLKANFSDTLSLKFVGDAVKDAVKTYENGKKVVITFPDPPAEEHEKEPVKEHEDSGGKESRK